MLDIKAKVVLVDIEGTTTSISFVKDVLFPYAKEHCQKYLQDTWNTDSTRQIVKDLSTLTQFSDFCVQSNCDTNLTPSLEQITSFVKYLINLDLKVKPLKTLQGLIWENGYKEGALIGHVYDDVPKAFQRWLDAGLRLAVYSSGSIWAQRLLFGQTKHGSLLKYLNSHFDTTSGMKTDSVSYKNIARELNVDPLEVLFLTDITNEAAAARTAGMQVAVLNRPGNSPLTDDEKSAYSIVDNFDQINVHL